MDLIPATFMLLEHEDCEEERKISMEIPERRVGFVRRRIKRLC